MPSVLQKFDPKAPIKGEEFSFVRQTNYQDRINANLARSKLTEAQIKSITKTTEMDVFKTTRINGKGVEFQTPNMGNMTLEGLVDSLGKVREEKARLEKEEGVYKEAIKARIKALIAEGEEQAK